MPSDDETTENRSFHGFGDVLRYARTTYGERLLNLPPGSPRVELSARALVDSLTENGYPISSSAFNAMEAGKSLPRDPDRFLGALYRSLGIQPGDALAHALFTHLAYDLIQRELGDYEDLLDLIVPEEYRRRDGASRRQREAGEPDHSGE